MRTRTVLIADDCALTREVHADLLRSLGCGVVAVGSGNAAVREFVRAVATRGTPYDLTLLDFDMPDGDGLQAVRDIQLAQAGLPAAAPVLCVTGHALARVERACLAAGFDAVIAKPLQVLAVAIWLSDRERP